MKKGLLVALLIFSYAAKSQITQRINQQSALNWFYAQFEEALARIDTAIETNKIRVYTDASLKTAYSSSELSETLKVKAMSLSGAYDSLIDIPYCMWASHFKLIEADPSWKWLHIQSYSADSQRVLEEYFNWKHIEKKWSKEQTLAMTWLLKNQPIVACKNVNVYFPNYALIKNQVDAIFTTVESGVFQACNTMKENPKDTCSWFMSHSIVPGDYIRKNDTAAGKYIRVKWEEKQLGSVQMIGIGLVYSTLVDWGPYATIVSPTGQIEKLQKPMVTTLPVFMPVSELKRWVQEDYIKLVNYWAWYDMLHKP